MNSILAWLVSSADTVKHIAEWSFENPLAAAIWGTFLTALLDRIVKLTPWKGDDSALDIIESALRQAWAKIPRGK
jgi:hypothetical protein